MVKSFTSIDMYSSCHGSHSAAAQRLVRWIRYKTSQGFSELVDMADVDSKILSLRP